MDLQKLAGFYVDHVTVAKQRFTEFLQDRKIPVKDNYLQALMPNLLDQLFKVTHKVLIAQYKLIEADASFDDFCDSLQQKEIRDYFYGRYPVMRRWMDSLTMNWVQQSCLLISRFTQDEARIKSEIFKQEGVLDIKAIRFNLGDAHRGGRSVARIDFGNGQTIIYKPRNLDIDIHFSQFVQWLNSNSELDLQTPTLLNCGAYGWVQFIEYRDCADQDEVDMYYRRLGAWLAVLYTLEGTDFHYENIIASGAHPVLIDLESFFHPEVPTAGSETNEVFDNSVLRTGILPNFIDLDAESMPDISGIADAEGKQGIVENLFMVRGKDGKISFERKKGNLIGAQNVPRLDNVKVLLDAQRIAQFQQGYKYIYQVLLDNKDAFRAMLDIFKTDEVRALFRNTVAYGHLLEESNHPSLMCDQKLIDQHFGLLTMVIPDYQAAARFVEFEIADLQQRDVPLFTTKADSRHLWYSDHGHIENFFDSSGFDRVLRKLAIMSEQDMNHQAWIIEKALVMKDGFETARVGAKERNTPAGDYSDPQSLQKRLLAEVINVADHIESQIHIDGEYASWVIIKAASLDNRKMELIPAFYDVYCGMPGEVLFLSQLHRVCGDEKYQVLAHKALNTLLFKVDGAKNIIRSLGLYIGWGGIISMLTHLAEIEKNNTYFEKIEYYFDEIDFKALIAADKSFALIKGSAGFALACAEYYLASGSARGLQLAKAAADHLISNKNTDYPGYSWLINSAVPLSGVAHGASGFAMAFAKLYEATNDAQYKVVCLKALEYERSLFVPEMQNWRDCRDFASKMANGRVVCSVAWAHGAPGIGLARLALIRAGISTPEIVQDLEIAIRTTFEKGFGDSHSLIYGSFGNLDLLLGCKRDAPPEMAQYAEQVAIRLLQEIDVNGWQLGERNFHPLGLMIGVTGIGYQCLRMAFPDQVPSLLGAESARQNVAS
jgi:type 2 lantibiotic biosynthesis protein LanM